MKKDPDVTHKLPIEEEGEALFRAVDDGIILCKLINTSVDGTVAVASRKFIKTRARQDRSKGSTLKKRKQKKSIIIIEQKSRRIRNKGETRQDRKVN